MSERPLALTVGVIYFRVPTKKIEINATHAHDSQMIAIVHYTVFIVEIVHCVRCVSCKLTKFRVKALRLSSVIGCRYTCNFSLSLAHFPCFVTKDRLNRAIIPVRLPPPTQ